MAVAYRAGSGVSAFGELGSVLLTIPTAVQVGDVMFLSATLTALTGTTSIATPAGWSSFYVATNGPTGSGFQGAVFTKTAVSADIGATMMVSAPIAQQLAVALAAYAGAGSIRSSTFTVGPTTPSTSVVAPAPSTGPQSTDLVIFFGSVRQSAATATFFAPFLTVDSSTATTPTFTEPAGAALRAQVIGVDPGVQNAAAFIGDHDNTNASRTITAPDLTWSIAGQVVLAAPPQPALTRPVTGTVTAAGTVTRQVATTNGASDTVTAADDGVAAALRSRPAPDTVTAADTADRATTGTRPAPGTVGPLLDAGTRATVAARPAADTAGLAGTATATVTQSVTPTGLVAAADTGAATRQVLGAGAETFTPAGTVDRGFVLARTTPDTVIPAGTVGRGLVTARAVAGTVTAAGTIGVTQVRVTGARTVPATVAPADTAATTSGTSRPAAGTVTLVGTAMPAWSGTRDPSDQLGTTDTAGPRSVVARATTEQATAGDTVDTVRGLDRAVTGEVTTTGQVDRTMTGDAAGDEATGLADDTGGHTVLARQLNVLLPFGDDSGAGQSMSGNALDTLALADLNGWAAATSRAVTEPIVFAADVDRVFALAVPVTELVAFDDDSMSSGRSMFTTITGTVQTGDTGDPSGLTMTRDAVDYLAILPADLTRYQLWGRALTGTVTVPGAASRAWSRSASADARVVLAGKAIAYTGTPGPVFVVTTGHFIRMTTLPGTIRATGIPGSGALITATTTGSVRETGGDGGARVTATDTPATVRRTR